MIGRRRIAIFSGALAVLACAGSWARADDELESLEQQTMIAAVRRVAPCVVGIETVGGMERAKDVLLGTGPTTGLVIDPQGYIISSAFNFVSKPASILVRLPDGTRKPAKLVAADHSRMLVLLKIEVARPLPAPEIAPLSEMRVGQWCIAVGRTFQPDRPNMAVGVLSATGRIWGKALQTDAAVSPNNYGGPLVDLRGRVLGVLVPLSPQSADEMAGYEWYDSGIGFAVPAEHVCNILPRLEQGRDLYTGLAGVSLRSDELFLGEAVIAACRARSPAAKAGLRAGDRVVEIGGRKIARSAELKEELSRRYAGDKVAVVALRGAQRIAAEVELVAKLAPYQPPLLGVLPMRTESQDGVAVRYVYPQSPAAGAGIVSGDVLVSLAGHTIHNREEAMARLAGFEADDEAQVGFRRAGKVRTAKIKFDRLSEALPPAELPPAHAPLKPGLDELDERGVVPASIPEFRNRVWAYVPNGYSAATPHGLVVWLRGDAAASAKELLARWKPLCNRHDLILAVPEPDEAGGWTSGEAALVERVIQQIQSMYRIDAARTAVCGCGSGGALACLLAFHDRQAIRAAAMIDASPSGAPPESDPLRRLAIYLAVAEKSPQAAAAVRLIDQARAQKIPVTVKSLGARPHDLDPAELGELARWIDMLDRI